MASSEIIVSQMDTIRAAQTILSEKEDTRDVRNVEAFLQSTIQGTTINKQNTY